MTSNNNEYVIERERNSTISASSIPHMGTRPAWVHIGQSSVAMPAEIFKLDRTFPPDVFQAAVMYGVNLLGYDRPNEVLLCPSPKTLVWVWGLGLHMATNRHLRDMHGPIIWTWCTRPFPSLVGGVWGRD